MAFPKLTTFEISPKTNKYLLMPINKSEKKQEKMNLHQCYMSVLHVMS